MPPLITLALMCIAIASVGGKRRVRDEAKDTDDYGRAKFPDHGTILLRLFDCPAALGRAEKTVSSAKARRRPAVPPRWLGAVTAPASQLQFASAVADPGRMTAGFFDRRHGV